MIPRDITPTEEQAQKIAEINAWFEKAVKPLRLNKIICFSSKKVCESVASVK